MVMTDGESAFEDEDEITPAALAQRIRTGSPLVLIDVREPDEWRIARLPHARLVPLGTLPDSLQSLTRDAEHVVYCHLGVRSAAAVAWLRAQGFTSVRNLTGGIERWSVDVDPTVRRY
jgi:rhodanese-related sulfurtransferase